MKQARVMGSWIPVILSVLFLSAPAGAAVKPPAFDQGVNIPAALGAARQAVRDDKTPFPPADAVPARTEVGFATGNEFSATILRGEISVSCHEPGRGSDHAWFTCREEILDPAEFVRFTGPQGVDADRVTLQATWENGKTRDKTKNYDPEKGRSSRFNLWIATLFQRPLLDYGRNMIRYIMKKDGRTVREGTFTANVKRGARRDCRGRRHYSSSNLSDCRAGSTTLCRRYFRDENYCQ